MTPSPLTDTIHALRRIGGRSQRPAPANLGYRHRLLLSRLETGRINSIADAYEAREAAKRLERTDLVRRAERLQRSLSRR